MATLHSVSDALLTLLNQVLLYVPKVISALIILIIGYIIARIVRGILTKGLRLVHFDQVTDRAGITAMLEPVLAIVVAWAWLGESLDLLQLSGAAVTLAGISLAQTSR